MCGIAGIINNTNANLNTLREMTEVISHRGPDGEGHWHNKEKNVAFGHRRLSIIDLSDAGKQPMHYLDRYTITFNGEIYNYVELKNDLLNDGYTFISHTDTEVLLALYSKYGKNCLKYLDGMFAFAIYDNVDKTVFCARDRFGEKPFYYAHKPNEYFIFGSEIKQLFKAGISKEFNINQLYNYLENPYALTNPDNEHDTFYSEIKKLPKASIIIVDNTLNITEEIYWQINLENKLNISYEEAVDQFRKLFFESIKRRMRSDVAIGSSLSGGVDSSSIVCSIQQLYKEASITQKTFSARFENFSRDEGKFIQYVLDQTKVTPYNVWPSEEGFLENIDKLMFHQDEPFPTASIYAQYCVMEEAKKQNVVVLLDGQGADEILAGYEYYLPFYLKELSINNPKLFKEEMEYMKALHPHLLFDANFQFISTSDSFSNKSNQISFKERFKNIIRPIYKLINKKKYERVLQKMPLNNFYNEEFFKKIANQKQYNFEYKNLSTNGFLKHSVQTCNLEDLLRFSDRNSMAQSREVRLPFLSTELVEFLFALPAAYKIKKGWTKAILRDAMHGILPIEIERRVDKIGYEPPQKKWMLNPKIETQVIHSYHTLIKHKILNENSLKERKLDWQVLNVAALLN